MINPQQGVGGVTRGTELSMDVESNFASSVGAQKQPNEETEARVREIGDDFVSALLNNDNSIRATTRLKGSMHFPRGTLTSKPSNMREKRNLTQTNNHMHINELLEKRGTMTRIAEGHESIQSNSQRGASAALLTGNEESKNLDLQGNQDDFSGID